MKFTKLIASAFCLLIFFSCVVDIEAATRYHSRHHSRHSRRRTHLFEGAKNFIKGLMGEYTGWESCLPAEWNIHKSLDSKESLADKFFTLVFRAIKALGNFLDTIGGLIVKGFCKVRQAIKDQLNKWSEKSFLETRSSHSLLYRRSKAERLFEETKEKLVELKDAFVEFLRSSFIGKLYHFLGCVIKGNVEAGEKWIEKTYHTLGNIIEEKGISGVFKAGEMCVDMLCKYTLFKEAVKDFLGNGKAAMDDKLEAAGKTMNRVFKSIFNNKKKENF